MRVLLNRAVATLTLGLAFTSSILGQNNCIHPRIISVTGIAEIKVAPDGVNLTLGVESHDKDLAVAKASNERSIKKLLSLARNSGIDAKNIQTSTLEMGPEYSDYQFPKLVGYQVSQTIELTLKDLSKYEELLTDALKAGVNRVDGISFFVADLRKYREEVRLKAVKAAREKAMAMAAELGQTVGKPWEVNEGTEDDTAYLPANFRKANAGSLGMPMRSVEPILAGGEITISAAVQISFQLE